MRDAGGHGPAASSARPPLEGPGRPETYVYPGQLLSAPQPVVAATILGTCVSVCLFDASAGIGGLNHFMLARSPRFGPPSARFGDVATPQLVDELCALGAVLRRLQAKVFGGMTGRMDHVGIARDLGARNIAVAFETLASLGIPVLAEDVGGPKSRKLVFDTADGRAWVRHF